MENYKIHAEKPADGQSQAEFFLQTNEGVGKPACHANMHNAVELLYVTEGSYHVLSDGITHDIEKGDLILFCSNTPHSVYTGKTEINRYYVIKISPTFFLHFLKFEECASYIMRFSVNRKEQKNLWRASELNGSEILRILHSLMEEDAQKREGYKLSISLKIAELMLSICRQDKDTLRYPNNQISQMVYRIMEYIQQHYQEDINEKTIAAQFNISYSYFSRSFKQRTGIPFKKYLNRIRILHAHQLLTKNDKSVSEIAMECGFNSISYFISVYKAETNKTPYQAKLTASKNQET